MLQRLFSIFIIGYLSLASASSVPGKDTIIPEAVLRLLEKEFPKARFLRESHFLTEIQQEKVDQLTGEAPPSNLIVSYQVMQGSDLKATVYFDTHKVRTASETLLIAVAPGGTVQKVKTVAFGEPIEYLPKQSWFDQFKKRNLEPGLALKQDIHGITGATITARKTVAAVRRSLALHQVLFGVPSG